MYSLPSIAALLSYFTMSSTTLQRCLPLSPDANSFRSIRQVSICYIRNRFPLHQSSTELEMLWKKHILH